MMVGRTPMTEMLRERHRALLEEAESRRLARQLRAGRLPKARSTIAGVAAVALGFLAALVLAVGLVAVLDARPAQAAFPGANGKIVFQSNRTTVDNPTGDYEIFSMNADGTEVTQLTDNTDFDTSPSLSADGNWVVFRSNRDGNAEIYMIKANGTDESRLTNNTTTDDNPTISPNGFTVAYTSYRDGDYDIIVQVIGLEFNLTSNISANDYGPAFSPDGTKIAFESTRDGNHEVYVMDTDPATNDATNLSNYPTSDVRPEWSPDGAKIAFMSNRSGNDEIHAMNASDGSSQKKLTRNAAIDSDPAWSPDGKKIAFKSSRGGDDSEIYTMKARPEGSKNRPKNLTKNDDSDDVPDWQPLLP